MSKQTVSVDGARRVASATGPGDVAEAKGALGGAIVTGKRGVAFAIGHQSVAAGTATLEAMRTIERHGGAQVRERAYRGFAALPAPSTPSAWFTVLGVPALAPTEVVRAQYRKLASDYHPDKPSGDAAQMARINAAWAEFQRERGLA